MADYTDLNVWQKSKELGVEVYKLTFKFNKMHFDFVSQIRRSVISISSNIAEGVGRGHKKETIHHLFIARGSLYELETQLIIATDLNILPEEEFASVNQLIQDCKKLLQGFINYHNKSK